MEDWRSGNMGDAFGTSRGQGDGLVELLWCGGHAVMHSQEYEVAPWFQYPVIDDDNGGSLKEDLFSEIFGEIPAASNTAGYCATPPQGGEKRKQSDTDEISSKVIRAAEESNAAAMTMTTSTPAQRTTTGKRRRAAQVHNLSERRRRDRINEKMRALQQLVPHCSNKTDKASMLDEAIQYLKSLQLQVQTMCATGGVMAPAPASGGRRYMQRMASTSSTMPPLRTCVQNDTICAF
uniref:Uncharacterized protein n=1 Tax=Avena sativa TaxID=4498 RepID=A0ACD6A218_AVESA